MKKSLFYILLFVVPVSLLAQGIKYVETFPKDNSDLSFYSPADFCLSESGQIYILDSEANKIAVFNNAGVYQREIKEINGKDLFSKPIALDFIDKEKLVILNKNDRSISVVNTNLSEWYKFGREDGSSSMEAPTAICTDQYGVIYVADNIKNLIMKYSSDGIYLASCIVISPIDVAVCDDLSVFVLAGNESSGYKVIKIGSDFISKETINLSNLQKAESITVNSFGEFYISDSELGQIFKYGKNGNILGSAIGNKSSSKAPGNFSNPTSVKVFSQNNEIDNLYILDERFKNIQLFQLPSQIKREKLVAANHNVSIKIGNQDESSDFTNFYFSDGKKIFLQSDGSVIIKKNDEILLTIPNIGNSTPTAIHFYNDNIYVVNSSKNGIDIFDKNGSRNRSIGPSIPNYGSIENISDFEIDENGNIYIADRDKNDVFLVDKLGIFVEKINPVGIANVKEPTDLALSKSNIYILCNGQQYIYSYNLSTKQLTQIRYPYSNFEEQRDKIAVSNDDIVFLHNAVNDEVTVYKDAMEISKLVDLRNERKISNMFYDNGNACLIVSRNETKSITEYSITFASKQQLSIVINSLGFSELRWVGIEGEIELYKRKIGEEDFNLIKTTNDTSMVLFESTDQIIEYAVKPVASDKYSNVVKDIFSFCKFIKNENPNATIQYLKEIEQLNPIIIKRELATIYRSQADKFISNQQYTKAINSLFELQQLNPQSFVLYIERSQLYQRMNKITEAVAEIETGIDRFPGNRDLLLQLIQLNVRKADYDLIISQCTKALEKFPGDEQIIYVMAEAFKRKERYNEATQFFRILYEQTGKVNYQIEVAKILAAQGKTSEAIVMYESLKKNTENKPLVISEIANLKIDNNDLPGAEKTLLEGLAEFPNSANLHFALGELYSKQNNKKSFNELEKAVDLDDSNSRYLLALGSEYLKNGKLDEAVYRYESALLLDETNPEVLFLLGAAYLQQNKIDYAFGHLLSASRLEPNNMDIKNKFEEAKVLREQKNKDREIIEFNYVEVGEISHSLLGFYDNNPFGTITLFNTRNYNITDLVITIESEIMGIEQTIVPLGKIEPNQYADISFNIKIDRNKYSEISKTKKTVMNFNLKYKDISGEYKNLVYTENLIVHN